VAVVEPVEETADASDVSSSTVDAEGMARSAANPLGGFFVLFPTSFSVPSFFPFSSVFWLKFKELL
jgi:hypothetical protein